VPLKYRSLTYQDHPIPIGYQQTTSQPSLIASMIDALQLTKSDTVLEIGTGSGYQTAILTHLAQHVYSIDRLASLTNRAQKKIKQLNLTNTSLTTADGHLGWPEHAPFNAIIVAACTPQIPQPLFQQLAEKGKIVIPLGHQTSWQTLQLGTKHADQIQLQPLCQVRFVPLIN
jgi:protein-L-isoaspartate(D-aspartate) O-methyltransferase